MPASRLTAAVEEDTDRLAAGAAVGAVALLASEALDVDGVAGQLSRSRILAGLMLSDTVATASSIDETVGAASLLALSCTVASRSIWPLDGAVAASCAITGAAMIIDDDSQ